MKKMLFLLAVVLVGQGSLTAQNLNQLTIDDKYGTPILIGHCNRDGFSQEPFAWFDEGYASYEIDKEGLAKISNPMLEGITITIVMGTWCSDSQREVPHFYRIMDDLKFNESNITLINVDSKKTVPGEDLSSLNIKRVPTFIFYRNGYEIGRIIESPVASLEKDMAQILEIK
jgi:thiol-disulfide isomerase/thioredoxin